MEFARDPFKPLTEVERNFQGAVIGRIEREGELWVRADAAARLIQRSERMTYIYAFDHRWRSIQEAGVSLRGHRNVTYYQGGRYANR
jgi:hypothetical protein